jgi:hypothetical protein
MMALEFVQVFVFIVPDMQAALQVDPKTAPASGMHMISLSQPRLQRSVRLGELEPPQPGAAPTTYPSEQIANARRILVFDMARTLTRLSHDRPRAGSGVSRNAVRDDCHWQAGNCLPVSFD